MHNSEREEEEYVHNSGREEKESVHNSEREEVHNGRTMVRTVHNPATESTSAQGLLFPPSPVSLLEVGKRACTINTRFTVGW